MTNVKSFAYCHHLANHLPTLDIGQKGVWTTILDWNLLAQMSLTMGFFVLKKFNGQEYRRAFQATLFAAGFSVFSLRV